jgi:hypothetical protein
MTETNYMICANPILTRSDKYMFITHIGPRQEVLDELNEKAVGISTPEPFVIERAGKCSASKLPLLISNLTTYHQYDGRFCNGPLEQIINLVRLAEDQAAEAQAGAGQEAQPAEPSHESRPQKKKRSKKNTKMCNYLRDGESVYPYKGIQTPEWRGVFDRSTNKIRFNGKLYAPTGFTEAYRKSIVPNSNPSYDGWLYCWVSREGTCYSLQDLRNSPILQQ